MAKRIWWVLAGVGALLAGLLVAFLARAPRTEIRLEVTGTAGNRVVGTYTADGVRHEVDAVIPADVRCAARRFEFRLGNPDGGAMTVTMHVGGDSFTRDSTARGGVEGGWSNGPFLTTSGGIHSY